MAEPKVSHLLNLQPELLLEIIKTLDAIAPWQDLCSLSCASSYFRSLLAPYVFTKVSLRNSEKSGASVDAVAKSEHHKYVRKIEFIGTAPGDEEDGFEDTEGVFPDIVRTVLSNLNRFPNLETVRIDWAIDFDNEWENTYELLSDSESLEERLRAEQEEAWRALNTRVYGALAQNTKLGFKELELINLIPKEASSFRTREFHALLGQLTHFTLSCWKSDDGDLDTVKPGYVEFTQQFDELFFKHLKSLSYLNISGNFLPIGPFGSAVGALNVMRSSMPLLTNFQAESIFLGPQLKDFLASHAQTLEHIHLEDCHVGDPYR